MSRIAGNSRRFLLGVAFVSVMSGTGGLLGAIGGVMLMLLLHALLGTPTTVVVLLLAFVALGTLAAMSLSLFLVAREARPLQWQLSAVPAPTSGE